MGLIKAAVNAVGSTMQDQWKEYIRCEDLGNDILMKKVTTKNGVISKDSAIQVAPGQIAVVFQNGKILDASAEPGIFTFDESTTPSFFAGQFGPVFKEMWARFTYNGAEYKEQAVFYLNAKEILGNKFGTVKPVSYFDWGHVIPNQMTGETIPLTVAIMCHGNYTFKISDPAIFMTRIAGIKDVYYKEEIIEQIRSEVNSALQDVLNELCTNEHKVPAHLLPNSRDEIKAIMNQKVYDAAVRARGLNIVEFVIEYVSLDDESQIKVNNYELSSNQYMQQGTLVGSYAEAVKDAANNTSGAMAGFMGVGMMNGATNGMMGGVATNAFNQPQNQTTQTPSVQSNSQPAVNFCPSCGMKSTGGNFCTNCGTKLK